MDISKFCEQGFQIFRQIIPRDLTSEIYGFLTESINLSLDAAKNEIGCSTDSDLIAEIAEIAAGRNGGVVSLTKSTRDALTGHFSLETRLSEILWQVPYSEPFYSIVSAILDSEKVFMHMPPTARFILPRNIYAGVPPHQDFSYNRHMDDFITIWIPFVDIDDDCGGVTVFEGSGQSSECFVQKLDSEFWQQGLQCNGYKPLHCKMNVGDILVLNKQIIHGSTANLSDRTRISIDFRFFGECSYSTKHYLDMQKRKVISPQ